MAKKRETVEVTETNTELEMGVAIDPTVVKPVTSSTPTIDLGKMLDMGALVAEAQAKAAKFEQDVSDAFGTVVGNQKVLNNKLDIVLSMLRASK